jgi:hypothetical protein
MTRARAPLAPSAEGLLAADAADASAKEHTELHVFEAWQRQPKARRDALLAALQAKFKKGDQECPYTEQALNNRAANHVNARWATVRALYTAKWLKDLPPWAKPRQRQQGGARPGPGRARRPALVRCRAVCSSCWPPQPDARPGRPQA